MTKLSSALLPFLLAACGGNVVVDGASSATSSAGGSTTTGAGGAVGTSVGAGTSFGPTGVGGSATVTTVAATSVGAGGSTSAGCGTGTFFQLTVGTETEMLDSSCTSQSPPLPVPFGQEFSGGPATNPGALTIEGCQSSAANSPGIFFSAPAAFAPGTYMVSDAKLVTAQVVIDLSGALTVDAIGPVGGTISGSFVFAKGPLMAVGKFAVCRAHDLDAN